MKKTIADNITEAVDKAQSKANKKRIYKTFDDLIFNPHPAGFGGIQAKMDFKNGFGVSVVQGEMLYTNNSNEYELAVLKNGSLCYSTHITNDVLGYLSKDDVTSVMKAIQRLHRPKDTISKAEKI